MNIDADVSHPPVFTRGPRGLPQGVRAPGYALSPVTSDLDFLQLRIRASEYPAAYYFVQQLWQPRELWEVIGPQSAEGQPPEYVGSCQIAECGKFSDEIEREVREAMPALGASEYDPEHHAPGALTVEFGPFI